MCGHEPWRSFNGVRLQSLIRLTFFFFLFLVLTFLFLIRNGNMLQISCWIECNTTQSCNVQYIKETWTTETETLSWVNWIKWNFFFISYYFSFFTLCTLHTSSAIKASHWMKSHDWEQFFFVFRLSFPFQLYYFSSNSLPFFFCIGSRNYNFLYFFFVIVSSLFIRRIKHHWWQYREK